MKTVNKVKFCNLINFCSVRKRKKKNLKVLVVNQNGKRKKEKKKFQNKIEDKCCFLK